MFWNPPTLNGELGKALSKPFADLAKVLEIIRALIQPIQSQTAVAIANGSTIVSNLTVSRVNPAAAVTGVILQPGVNPSQEVTVINESAFTVTFAAAATSNVANGTLEVIPATSGRRYLWNRATAKWYPL